MTNADFMTYVQASKHFKCISVLAGLKIAPNPSDIYFKDFCT